MTYLPQGEDLTELIGMLPSKNLNSFKSLGMALLLKSYTLKIPFSEPTKAIFPSLETSNAVGLQKVGILVIWLYYVASHMAIVWSSLMVTSWVVSPSSLMPLTLAVWNLPSSTNGVTSTLVSFSFWFSSSSSSSLIASASIESRPIKPYWVPRISFLKDLV